MSEGLLKQEIRVAIQKATDEAMDKTAQEIDFDDIAPVLDEAKAECPLNKQLISSYGDKIPSLEELQILQLKLFFEFNDWFKRWFGEPR